MQELNGTKQELQEYLEIAIKHADNAMKHLRAKAEKKFRETDKRLMHISENGELFKEIIDENSSAMDKYSQKIYEKVEETISSFKKPEKFTLRNIEEYSQNARSALLAQDEILIKYVKLLKGAKYKKRVKLLSKSLQKLNKDLTKFERFITEEYVPSADIENTSHIIEETIQLIDQIEEKYLQLLEKEEVIVEKDNDINKLTKKLKELLEHPEKIYYQEALTEYTETQKIIDTKFSNLRKALRKYENIAAKSREKIDTRLVRELIKDAASCLANQTYLTSIENLLITIQEKLNNAALQLKKDKREAIKEDIQKLIDGDLKNYWEQSRNVAKIKEESSIRLKNLDLENKISKLKSSLEAAKRDRNRIIEREIRDINKLNEEITKRIEEINTRLSTSTGKEINLTANIPQIPEWALQI